MSKNTKVSMEDLFLKLGEFNGESTRFVKVDEFIGDYSDLKLGNGFSWGRKDGNTGKKYKICSVKSNVDFKTRRGICLSWDPTSEELEKIWNDIKEVDIISKGNAIYMLKIYGIQSPKHTTRGIRKDIKDFIKTQSCVVCGSNHEIEADHKNGLYNDSRVLNLKTQLLDDFQALCRHCNLQKRQTYKTQSQSGIRYAASKIPSLKHLKIDYTKGGAEYDPKDIDAMVGTYWYDPVKFMDDAYWISIGL